MGIYMKRTCNKCKALIDDSSCGFICSLGYQIKITTTYEHVPTAAKPIVECPKPLTYKNFYKLKNKL